MDIENTSTFKEIKVTYKKLADMYHPDKKAELGDKEKEEYAHKMKLLNMAKDTLTDPIKRAKHDQKIGIDIFADLRKLKSFRTESSVAATQPSSENYYQGGGYGGDQNDSYERYGADTGVGTGYDNGASQTQQYQNYGNQSNYGDDPSRYYYSGQRYQDAEVEKQTYLCPYCNKKFRMETPTEIIITSCPTCQNDITIYPE